MCYKTKIKPLLYEHSDGKCMKCKRSIAIDLITIDHIEPQSKTKNDDIDNLGLLCMPCNNLKDNKSFPVLFREDRDGWGNYLDTALTTIDSVKNSDAFKFIAIEKDMYTSWEPYYDENLKYGSVEAINHYLKWYKKLESLKGDKGNNVVSPQGIRNLKIAAAKSGVLYTKAGFIIEASCINQDLFKAELLKLLV